MFSPKLEFAKVWPCSVKSQTLLKGTMQEKGSILKVQMWDNSECEIEIVHSDPAKFKVAYKILKSSKPCYQNVETTCSVRMRPVTFCGCPFLQAIHDKNCVGGTTGSQKTYLEWKHKFNKPITSEMMEAVRSDKLTIISDMMKDISGEQALMAIMRKKDEMEMYVQKKIGTETMAARMPSQCPMGGIYTY